MTIRKSGNDSRPLGFFNLDTFGLILNVDLLLPQHIQQSLSHHASGDSECAIAVLSLTAVEDCCNSAQVAGRDKLKFFVVPSLVGDPVVHTNTIEGTKRVGCKGDKSSIKSGFVSSLKDLARYVALIERERQDGTLEWRLGDNNHEKEFQIDSQQGRCQ